jgi:hypothetical protein
VGERGNGAEEWESERAGEWELAQADVAGTSLIF